MESYIFRTNFKCQNCVTQVTPILEDNDQIKKWEIIENQEGTKFLHIEGENLDIHTILENIEALGFVLNWETQ